MQNHTAGMTLEEQIGQLFVVGFQGTTITDDIIDLIRTYHVGNIILFSRNIQSAQQVRELTHNLQMIAQEAGQRYPLLIATDQENGMVRRLGEDATLLPGNMALGASASEQLAYDVALATGQELKALGINMNLAPVVDINNNPSNPVIGIRSFGEDPQQVARLGAATVKGYRAAGIVTCLKHFPGHGDTAVDSHLSLPTIPYGMERLEAVELVPFKSGITAGADSVMIAHLYLPSLMRGNMRPSTVSPEIVSGILREKLGYDGVIISDCLEMDAVAKTIGVERGSVMALQAGNDLILVSHHYARQKGSIEALKDAVQEGIVTAEQVQQAAERVMDLKAKMLSWDALPDITVPLRIGSETHQQLQKQAYERTVTLVKNEEALVPLHLEPDKRILVVLMQASTYTQAVDKAKVQPNDVLAESIRQRHALVDTITIPVYPTSEDEVKLRQLAEKADVVIFLTVNAHLDPTQQGVVIVLEECNRSLIGIAALNPYDLLTFPELKTYLVTYEYTPPALVAAVRVLFGEIVAQGKLPVSLTGVYP